ncbi:DegT/DnrJ/EryC1/StrS family aminotransferase, partial [Candidatus Peregrinibacteria bacterium]|nr:DegT/DnrJ/EryC1/StrS family aminotransferase [Candidatus Peregrinibacteria bacterium]
GQNEHSFDYIKKFEAAFADYVGVRYTLATSCCTGALHLSLWALGISAGDEVIVPDMTWVASAAPIIYVGATPVFVDTDMKTFCIAPAAIEKAITPKTKAIIAVHTYGYPADMEAISAIAKKHNLFVIEDAAPSLGTTIKAKRTGSGGIVSGFSFHGSKIAASGEGGMLCTNDKDFFERVKVIGNHGRDGGRVLTAVRWGIKYNMSNLQAAFGLAQLERMPELLAKKRQNYDWYKEELAGIQGITVSSEAPDVVWNCWQTSIVLDQDFGITRDGLMDELKKSKIDTRPFFPPISTLPMVARDLSKQNPSSYYLGERGLNLPSRHDLKRGDVTYVVSEIRRILGV